MWMTQLSFGSADELEAPHLTRAYTVMFFLRMLPSFTTLLYTV